MPLPKTDLEELKRAKLILENPGLAAKLANYVGSPVEQGMKLLPKSWQKGVHSATEKALMKALEVAVRSLGERRRATSSDRFHKVAVATSGAIGGAFGIAARFGIVVSEKTAAQLVPVIGAAGGALINTVFIAHYQDMARGHFIVRRLEKIHGAEPVRIAYEDI